MGYACCHLVDPTTPGTFHCASRCVRRAFLCGIDEFTNQSYEHRRGLLEARIHLLAGQFAVALHAYAVMSNHLHLVIAVDPLEPANWTDAEVVERWRRVFPVKAKSATASDDTDAADPNALTPDQQVEPERIAIWRQRLGSLSWFMRALLEPRIRTPRSIVRMPQQAESRGPMRRKPEGQIRKTAALVASGRTGFSPKR